MQAQCDFWMFPLLRPPVPLNVPDSIPQGPPRASWSPPAFENANMIRGCQRCGEQRTVSSHTKKGSGSRDGSEKESAERRKAWKGGAESKITVRGRSRVDKNNHSRGREKLNTLTVHRTGETSCGEAQRRLKLVKLPQ